MYAETRPATGHPSYGRVDGFFNSGITVGSPVRRTTQSALHVMLLSYYIGMCVFHERCQRDIFRRRASYSQGRAHIQRQAQF